MNGERGLADADAASARRRRAMARADARALYGGAVLARVPTRFRDLSAVVVVPDHQEFFYDENTRESLHVELVDGDDGREDGVTVTRRLFYDWVDACDGASTSAVTVETRGGDGRTWTRASGTMRARGNDGRFHDVDVHGGVIDFEQVRARALIWHCRPRSGDGDGAAASGKETAASAVADDASDGGGGAPSEVLRECAESLTIVDWSLFG